MTVRTSDRDTVVFKGSTESFDDVAGEFGEFVEEENSSVREEISPGEICGPPPMMETGLAV